MRLIASAWIALLLALGSVSATEHPDRYERFDVELMTIGPGPIYWERFGHNAILLRERQSDQGVTYNFGMFDFEQQNFFLNFARGLMQYRAIKYALGADLETYRQSGRAVWIQRLNLTREQKNRLIDYLNHQTTPGNDSYRYHYFDANCSTRIRDALDYALAGTLSDHFDAIPARQSTRQFVRELTAQEPWLFASTLLALGRDVDRAGSRWHDFFVPMELADGVGQFRQPNGQPLASPPAVLFDATQSQPSQPRPIWLAVAIGIALGALILARPADRRGGRWLPISWLALSGIGGAVLSGLWLLTNHDAAFHNENLLLLSPLALIAAVGFIRRARWTLGLCAILAVMAVVAAAGKPWLLWQDNWEVIAVALPAQLATWWSCRRLNFERLPRS